MRILIVKLSSIGDVVQTLPALYSLRETYPKAEIDWLVETESMSILNDNPALDNLFVVRKNGFLTDFANTQAIVKAIRNRSYDFAIDFQGLFKSGIWVYLSHAKRRIGFDKGREFSYIFLNDRCSAYDINIHAVERYLSLAAYAGASSLKVSFPVSFTRSERDKVYDVLSRIGYRKNERMAIISPRARWASKLWSTTGFAELATRIRDVFGMRVVITGSESDMAYVSEICRYVPEAVNLSGDLTLKELAFLMKQADVVISLDSGPMHIASAVGTPVVALFGPTGPGRTGPHGRHFLIRKDMECSPCFSRSCDDRRCMNEIKVGDIMKGISEMLLPGSDCFSGQASQENRFFR